MHEPSDSEYLHEELRRARLRLRIYDFIRLRLLKILAWLCCKNSPSVIISLTFSQIESPDLFMHRTPSPFKWRHCAPDVILLCVRWYRRYQLSYRDVEEMMRERGLDVDHSTVFRRVRRYAPEINKRIRQRLKDRLLRLKIIFATQPAIERGKQ